MNRPIQHLAWFLLLVGAAAPVAAGSPPETMGAGTTGPSAADIATARDLFRDGARLAQQEKWEAALDAYQRSMALRPSNLTRYSIAVVQERLGKLVVAMENLREFLDHEQDRSTLRYLPNARRMLRSIERRIARIKVVIPGNPRGAQVLIDGQDVPPAAIGVNRPSDPGEHRIEARVPGNPTFVKTVDVDEGEEIEVVVQLGQGDQHDDGQTSARDAGRGRADFHGGRSGGGSAGVLLTVAGGAVFAAGFGLGIYGYTKAKNAETSEGDDADSARKFALIGDFGMGVGLVAAGVGTYLLVSQDDAAPDASAGMIVSPWAGQGAAGLAAAGRF